VAVARREGDSDAVHTPVWVYPQIHRRFL